MAACLEKANCMLIISIFFNLLLATLFILNLCLIHLFLFQFYITLQITKPPQKLTLAHSNKLDAAIENKPASNDSTGSVASTQKNNETSEAQVSLHPLPCAQFFTEIIYSNMNIIVRLVNTTHFSVLSVK